MISKEDVLKIAQLAKIEIKDEAIDAVTQDLSKILGYVEKLGELDLKDVVPTSHAVDVTNVFRKDEVIQDDINERVLDSAPQRDGRFFTVPRVI